MVLRLLFREPEEGPDAGVVAAHLAHGVLHDEPDDELLHQGEEMAVRIRVDLVERALFVGVEAGDAAHARNPFREKRLVEVEVAAPKAVVDRPGVRHRVLETRGIAERLREHGSQDGEPRVPERWEDGEKTSPTGRSLEHAMTYFSERRAGAAVCEEGRW